MQHHVVPVRTYLMVFVALLVLLVATVGAYYVDLGPLNIAVALTIALVKAALIVLYFMHVRYSSRLVWVFAAATVVWLIIMLGLTFSDYISRTWLAVVS
mgnify:CR=1 FL=1